MRLRFATTGARNKANLDRVSPHTASDQTPDAIVRAALHLRMRVSKRRTIGEELTAAGCMRTSNITRAMSTCATGAHSMVRHFDPLLYSVGALGIGGPPSAAATSALWRDLPISAGVAPRLLVACTSTPSWVKKRHMAMSPLRTLQDEKSRCL